MKLFNVGSITVFLMTTVWMMTILSVKCESSYGIGSLTSNVEVTDDCYVNIVESFTVTNNEVDKELAYFSRFISKTIATDVVPLSIIATSLTKKIVNTTVVKSDQYFEIAVFLETPILKAGSDAFTLSYQVSGPLVASETVDSVKIDLAGPITIFPKKITIQFTDNVKRLHGYRQFTPTSNTIDEAIITEKSISWEYNYAANPWVKVSFPSLATFDICRTLPPEPLISINVVNLILIITLLVIQAFVVVFLCFTHFRKPKYTTMEPSTPATSFN